MGGKEKQQIDEHNNEASALNGGLENLAQRHKQAYEEILKHLQDSELAARNKEYITARTCALNAVDCAAKWHKVF